MLTSLFHAMENKKKYARQFRTTLAPVWQKRMFQIIVEEKTDIAKFVRVSLKEHIQREEERLRLKRGN